MRVLTAFNQGDPVFEAAANRAGNYPDQWVFRDMDGRDKLRDWNRLDWESHRRHIESRAPLWAAATDGVFVLDVEEPGLAGRMEEAGPIIAETIDLIRRHAGKPLTIGVYGWHGLVGTGVVDCAVPVCYLDTAKTAVEGHAAHGGEETWGQWATRMAERIAEAAEGGLPMTALLNVYAYQESVGWMIGTDRLRTAAWKIAALMRAAAPGRDNAIVLWAAPKSGANNEALRRKLVAIEDVVRRAVS